jgi:hypothetical protein
MSPFPHEPDSDDALMIADQWRKDTGCSPDATVLAAGLIWLAYNVSASAKDLCQAIRDIECR